MYCLKKLSNPSLTQLILRLGDAETRRVAVDDERGDTPIGLRRIGIGEDEEDARDVRVGYPHLAAVDDVVRAVAFRYGLQREGVRARARFRQAETTRVLVRQLR